ncbi:MAG: hypothetical protein ABIH63_00575, partial [archaeon]
GTFKAKLGKNLAEAMRKDSSIILRLISNNKLSEEAKHLGITYLIYETNKLRENNEIEIKGVMPQTGVSFGIIKKAEGNCGDYLASMKVGPAKEYKTKAAAPTVITKETQKPGKAGIREKTKATPTIKPEMKEKKHFVPPPSEAITTKPGIEEVDKTGISSVRKYDMTYRKAWGLRGSYDWMQNYQKKDVENMYEELKQAFKDNQPEYIFINRTMGTEKGVPKVVVEFSNKGEESRLEKLLDAHKDMNNPSKKVTILNFGEREPGFGKKEKLGYETMVPLTGLTPGEAAKLASTKILEKIHEMRTQGHFDTYSFKRDVRSLDKNINPGIKAYLFVTKGTKKAIGAVFAEENTEVKLVSEDDKLDNDNIQIGESLEQKLGPNQGKGGAAGPGAGGGVGDGGPGGK